VYQVQRYTQGTEAASGAAIVARGEKASGVGGGKAAGAGGEGATTHSANSPAGVVKIRVVSVICRRYLKLLIVISYSTLQFRGVLSTN